MQGSQAGLGLEVPESYGDHYFVLGIPRPANAPSNHAEQAVCDRVKFAHVGPFLIPFVAKDAHVSVVELVEFLILALLVHDMVSKIGL